VATLLDTNILVYRYDPRFPNKQAVAHDLLRWGIEYGMLVLPHQALLEFVAAVTRPGKLAGGAPLLSLPEACREVEELMQQFPVLYPSEAVVRTALRGAAAYQLSWFDAHLWAYAEVHGLPELLSEDFQHDRTYGTVRLLDPFQTADSVHEGPVPWG
jgi:predicted nucleic acid-binding protein